MRRKRPVCDECGLVAYDRTQVGWMFLCDACVEEDSELREYIDKEMRAYDVPLRPYWQRADAP